MSAILKANNRDNSKKSIVKQLRREGKLPGVVYGKDKKSKPVFLDSIDFMKTVREVGKNGVITLDVEGNKHSVVVTDLQTDSLKAEYLHADFHEIDMNEEMKAEVPVRLVGEAIGLKEGGVLQHSLRTISVTALPSEVPSEIQLDISELQIGQAVTIGDYKEGSTYEINNHSDEVIVTITPPTLGSDPSNQPEEEIEAQTQEETHDDEENV
jgi:large subunit ribosomal protein L25